MGSLPSVHLFYGEDYQKSDEDFKRFLGQLNDFTDPVYRILNGSVEVAVNTNEEFYIINISTASATGSSNTFTFTPLRFIGKPRGVLLAQCVYNTTTGIPTAVGAAVTLDWIWTGSQVKILAVYGLTAAASYTLTLRIC